MKKYRMTHVLCSALLLFLVSCLTPQSVRADYPYIGEIRWVAFDFAPMGWASCNGQLLPIFENEALYSLIGTTFGGDGQYTFALPDLRGRAPIHVSPGYYLGSVGGEENHVLTLAETPDHKHFLKVDPREGSSNAPAWNYPAKSSGGTSAYGSSANAAMASSSIGIAGGGQPHENMKPFITLNCIIAYEGIYPQAN